MSIYDTWLMDSEYCGNCGTALSLYESVLCYDCQQDKWYDEDQDYYDGWGSDWDLPIEEAEDTVKYSIPWKGISL